MHVVDWRSAIRSFLTRCRLRSRDAEAQSRVRSCYGLPAGCLTVVGRFHRSRLALSAPPAVDFPSRAPGQGRSVLANDVVVDLDAGPRPDRCSATARARADGEPRSSAASRSRADASPFWRRPGCCNPFGGIESAVPERPRDLRAPRRLAACRRRREQSLHLRYWRITDGATNGRGVPKVHA